MWASTGVQNISDLFNSSLANLSKSILTYHVIPGVVVKSNDTQIPLLDVDDMDDMDDDLDDMEKDEDDMESKDEDDMESKNDDGDEDDKNEDDNDDEKGDDDAENVIRLTTAFPNSTISAAKLR